MEAGGQEEPRRTGLIFKFLYIIAIATKETNIRSLEVEGL